MKAKYIKPEILAMGMEANLLETLSYYNQVSNKASYSRESSDTSGDEGDTSTNWGF